VVFRSTLLLLRAGLTAWPASRPSNVSMDQVGIYLGSTARAEPVDLNAALDLVQSLGLHMIQISRLPERFYTKQGGADLLRMMRMRDIHATSVAVIYDGENYKDQRSVVETVGLRPAALMEERLEYTRKCVDFAAQLGVKFVTFHAGALPADPASADYQRMLEAMIHLTSYSRHRGVALALETGPESAEELLRFVGQIDTGRVGIQFDIASLVLYGRDNPPAALRALLGRITSVHIKDGLPPAAAGQLGVETRLGEGKAGVRECLRLLRDSNFPGPLVIESDLGRRPGADPAVELRRAVDFVSRALGE
jgi:sugar phosphate isomerase/epimerase